MNKALSITDTSDTFANRRWPFGLLAFLAALVSLLTCYVTIITSMLAGSSALELNPHVQAVIMWGFGLLAVVAMGRDRARHLRNYRDRPVKPLWRIVWVVSYAALTA
jgi:hypothetical protein